MILLLHCSDFPSTLRENLTLKLSRHPHVVVSPELFDRDSTGAYCCIVTEAKQPVELRFNTLLLFLGACNLFDKRQFDL